MSQRHASPSLRGFPPEQLHVMPLGGVEAQIYNRLWCAIIEGKLKPGAKLREESIGEAFGVSRTITRKVLFIMEQEGSVSLPVNRGAYVATPKPEDIPVVFETLGMAVLHVIQALCDWPTVIDPGQRALLDEHIGVQEAADREQDIVLSQMIGNDFLVLLAAIHGNPVITDLIARMLMRQMLIIMMFRQVQMPPERAGFQREMVTAILDRRTDDAVAVFRARHSLLQKGLSIDDDEDQPDLAAILMQPPRSIAGLAAGRC